MAAVTRTGRKRGRHGAGSRSGGQGPTATLLTPGLSPRALRLLRALAVEGASARPDPGGDGSVIVSTRSKGVSLGRGEYPRAAMRELIDRDMATGSDEGSRFTASEAGRAHLRRLDAVDQASRFEAQHREIASGTVVLDEEVVPVRLNAAESPLAWLRSRRGRDGEPLIDAAAFEAGERLRRDLTFAGMLPSVTARWDGAVASGAGGVRDPAGATDAVIAARQRVRSALLAVGGDMADLLVDLCGFLKGLETIERDRGWPPRAGKVVVRLALGQLARHYGLEAEARGPAASRGVQSWAASAA